MHPAIFLDRDGVIIENREAYVRSWSDVSIFPRALRGLVQIATSTYKIVIVTNQSAVGRELMTLEVAGEINRRLVEVIFSAGGRIDGTFMCPHAPEVECSCRKPRPGLLLEAAQSLGLDLNRSILIGDSLSDLAAAKAAGLSDYMLVLTGRGSDQVRLPQADALQPFPVYATLYDALHDVSG